jgi:hypothetical protein
MAQTERADRRDESRQERAASSKNRATTAPNFSKSNHEDKFYLQLEGCLVSFGQLVQKVIKI